MCSLHLTHPSAHTPWSSGQPMLRRPGSSWGFGALLKGLTSVVDNSCQSQDLNPQPRVTNPTLYPLEPRSIRILEIAKLMHDHWTAKCSVGQSKISGGKKMHVNCKIIRVKEKN